MKKLALLFACALVGVAVGAQFYAKTNYIFALIGTIVGVLAAEWHVKILY